MGIKRISERVNRFHRIMTLLHYPLDFLNFAESQSPKPFVMNQIIFRVPVLCAYCILVPWGQDNNDLKEPGALKKNHIFLA